MIEVTYNERVRLLASALIMLALHLVALQVVCKLGMAMDPIRTFTRWRPAGQPRPATG